MVKTRRKFVISVVCCAAIALLSCGTGWAEPIQWHPFNEGLALSKSTGKKVFLYFYSERCGYCEKMESHTFHDVDVISYLNDHYISVKVDAARDHNLSRQYNVRGVPATWFITENDEKIRNRPGYIAPDQLLPLLKYVASDSYKTLEFDAFLKQQS